MGVQRYIFGGDTPWNANDWTATDDRVRGGSSISHLTIHPSGARFHGTLDTTTLGGAGFASQRTTGTLSLDLSGSSGIGLRVRNTDGKRYLITLKDDIPERRPDGREQSGVSWEAEIETAEEGGASRDAPFDVYLPWSAFKATYRGRDKPDAEPLDLQNIKRVSFMMRSFFGKQEGDFSIDLESVYAVASPDNAAGADGARCSDESSVSYQKANASHHAAQQQRKGWKGWFCGLL